MFTIRPTIDVPLRVDEGGAVRVGNTRVLFYLVVQAFQAGQSPELVRQSYDTLKLEDVYAVYTYYLLHKAEVDAYVQTLMEESDRFRAEHPEFFHQLSREDLVKRLQAKQQAEAV